MTTSHCELQSNDSGPPGINAEDSLTLDVRESFALGMSLNLDEVIEIPAWAECPCALTIRQNCWGARAARSETRPLAAVERQDVVTRLQADRAIAMPGKKWGFRGSLRFQFAQRSPHPHEVPAARNQVGKIL